MKRHSAVFRAAATVLWTVVMAAPAFAQQTVFVVRHAERADSQSGLGPTPGSDPDLSAAGHARAQSLAAMLRDAAISAIFVTEYKRTQQTAAPLARALGIQPASIVAKDTGALVSAIRKAPGPVLVVGHSNSLPEVLKALGVTQSVSIGDNDYDDLFIVSPGEPATLIRLHFR